jgi:valyl-tRNA synthetase
VLKEAEKNIVTYRFNEAANVLYGFFWHEFCDWYLEIVKPDISPARNNLAPQGNISNGVKNRQNQVVMYKILEKFLRILHPFMPFITEEIWQRLPHQGDSIMISPWPHIQQQFIDRKLEKQVQSVFELVTQIRNLRGSIDIKPEQKVSVSIYAHSKEKESLVRSNSSLIISLAKLEDLKILDKGLRPSATISNVVEDIDIFLHFTGLVDIAKEQSKIKERCLELTKARDVKEARLKNKDFAKNAPAEIVEKERMGIEELGETLKRLERMLREFK